MCVETGADWHEGRDYTGDDGGTGSGVPLFGRGSGLRERMRVQRVWWRDETLEIILFVSRNQFSE
jgi:hypothetical protein